jgi:hypothetical protein
VAEGTQDGVLLVDDGCAVRLHVVCNVIGHRSACRRGDMAKSRIAVTSVAANCA